jgi:hypothetical protein
VSRSKVPSIEDVALAAGDALRRRGITAVLTGGACASLHSRGRYHSADVDFVLGEGVRRADLDAAMAEIGYRRKVDRYVSATNPYWIEFPRGPLAVGADYRVLPVRIRRKGAVTLALSPTDSCRDRLAAFYHWGDRQALAAAVEIAVRNRLGLALIRRWSIGEGSLSGYQSFLQAVREARRLLKG